MTREEAILYLEHTSSDDFNLEEHQIQNRLNAIQFLLEENQELKKQLHEASLTIQEMTEQDIECPSNCEKLRRLKKQLEEKENIACDWKDSCLENAGKIEILENQQKEFIKWLEDEIEQNTPNAKWKHYNEDGFNDYDVENGYGALMRPVYMTLKEILQKYKSIIGVSDENN